MKWYCILPPIKRKPKQTVYYERKTASLLEQKGKPFAGAIAKTIMVYGLWHWPIRLLIGIAAKDDFLVGVCGNYVRLKHYIYLFVGKKLVWKCRI